jgi:hypothetical protein
MLILKTSLTIWRERDLPRPLILITLSVLLLGALPHFAPMLAAGDSQITLSVFSEDSFSPNLVDPTFVVGSSFNITVVASNLPPVVDQNSGGLAGFDISLTYNASVIRPEKAGFNAPFCPASDGCIFDVPKNDTITTASLINTPPGTLREAMVALGPGHRAVLPTIRGQPAFLFRATFDVVGKGLAPIKIQQAASQLLGFSTGCGSLLAFTTMDGSFDNRAPFRITATPLTPTVAPNGSVNMQVNVSLVNSAGNGNVNLYLSGIIVSQNTPQFKFQFTPASGTLFGPSGMNSFGSSLQIIAAPAPVTPPGSYSLTIAGVITSPASNHFQYNYNFTLTVTGSGASTYAVPLASTTRVQQILTTAQTNPVSGLLAAFTTSSSPTVASPITFHAVAVWCFISPYTLHWDFGDGTSGTGNPASHAYSTPGTYTATLNVTDSSGKSYLSSQTLTIPANSPQPVPPPPGVNITLLSSLILLALFFITAAVLFVRRRRKS